MTVQKSKYVTPKVLLEGLASTETETKDKEPELKDGEVPDTDKRDDGKGNAPDTETIERTKRVEKTEPTEKVEPTKMTSGVYQQTAKVTNTQVGVCPVCQKTMKVTQANNIPVFVCLDHNVVMPTQD